MKTTTFSLFNIKHVALIVAVTGLLLSSAFMPLQKAQAQTPTSQDLSAQIQRLLLLVSQLQAQLAAQTGTTPGSAGPDVPERVGDGSLSGVCPYTWTRNLGVGASGGDVFKLQQFLNANPRTQISNYGFGSPGSETRYYGNATANAVSKFQSQYRSGILIPAGLTNGNGFLGSLTRAKINTLCASRNGDVTDIGTPTPAEQVLSVDLVKGYEENGYNSNSPGDDEGYFELIFDVTALDDDIYIPNRQGDSPFSYIKESSGGSTDGKRTTTLTSTARGGDGFYRVDEGSTERFNLVMRFNPTSPGTYKMVLAQLPYSFSPVGSIKEYKIFPIISTDSLKIDSDDSSDIGIDADEPVEQQGASPEHTYISDDDGIGGRTSIAITGPINGSRFGKNSTSRNRILVEWDAENIPPGNKVYVELDAIRLTGGGGVGGGIWGGEIPVGDSTGKYRWVISGLGRASAGEYRVRTYIAEDALAGARGDRVAVSNWRSITITGRSEAVANPGDNVLLLKNSNNNPGRDTFVINEDDQAEFIVFAFELDAENINDNVNIEEMTFSTILPEGADGSWESVIDGMELLVDGRRVSSVFDVVPNTSVKGGTHSVTFTVRDGSLDLDVGDVVTVEVNVQFEVNAVLRPSYNGSKIHFLAMPYNWEAEWGGNKGEIKGRAESALHSLVLDENPNSTPNLGTEELIPQPYVTLRATPSNIKKEEKTTLSWRVDNATRCVLLQADGEESVSFSGSKLVLPRSNVTNTTVYPATYTYTLWCANEPGNGKDGPSASAQATVTVADTPAPAGDASVSKLINAAGGTYTDYKGNLWNAYAGEVDGSIAYRGSIEIANTKNDKLYQTERWGVTSYDIPVPNGKYTVKLHFAETYRGIKRAGQRVFSVNVEGKELNNLDVYKKAGGRNRALVKTFKNLSVSDGNLDIDFTKNIQNTMINGIEIIAVGSSNYDVNAKCSSGYAWDDRESLCVTSSDRSGDVKGASVTKYDVQISDMIHSLTSIVDTLADEVAALR